MAFPPGYVQIGVKVPSHFITRLDTLQERRYCDRATLVREAIARFLDHEERRLAAQDAELKAPFSEDKTTEAA